MRSWPADAFEGLDDDHAGAAAGARAWRHGRRIGGVGATEIIVGRIDGLYAQQCAGFGEVGLALAVRQQSVMGGCGAGLSAVRGSGTDG